MCAHLRLRSACRSAQSDHSLMGALRVAKGPKLLQAEDCAWMQTDFNVRCMHIPNCTLCWIPAQYKMHHFSDTVELVLSGHSKKDQKLVFKTDYRLMQVKSIAEGSKWSMLQYFRPSLKYYLLLSSLFCHF